MKFVSVRELRNSPGKIWEELKDEDMVVTSNGKPVGILVGVAEEGIEDALASVRRARASLALSRMRRKAAEAGLDRLSEKEIDAEVRAVRKRRA